MKGIGLAPSPNWYCSRVSDCTTDGLFAFGIKQNIALLQLSTNPPIYAGVLNGRTVNDRIVGVKFALTQTELVSASEAGTITIWNVNNSLELKQIHAHQAKVTSIDWSPVDYDLIASGDEKGNVCIHSNNTTKRYQVHKNGQISVLTFSPYNKNTLAVGFRDGLILIVDISSLPSHIHLLRRHEDEIQSLCWFKSAESPDIYLASGGKDATVRRWDVVEGKLMTTNKIPQYSSGYRSRHQDDHVKSRLWVTVYWCHKLNFLICSGYHGELLALSLCKENVKQQWEVICSKDFATHNRSIFNITGFGTMACTISMDRQIIVWDLATRKSVHSIATLGGFVYGLHFSPVDIGRLAVAVGDNIIRVWNTQLSAGSYNVSSFWQGLRSKVTTVAWHPKYEGRLAFGTDEGRVGIYNVLSNKPPYIANSNHKGTVYTVVWGVSYSENAKDEEMKPSKLIVYSCGNGLILVHPNDLKDEKSSQDFNTIIEKQNPQLAKFPPRSEIAWNDTLTLVAIGNDDGSIEVYSMPSVKRLLVIVEIRKLIQCLRWHPTNTAQTNESPYRFWLAASSNDSSISVYDLEQHLSNREEEEILMKCTRKLEGHKLRVVSLNWSPHLCGHLASVSYDGTAQVWDVINAKGVANFRGHNGRVFAVEWNPLDPDVIYTGGEDSTAQRWIISEQEHKMPPEMNSGKSKKNKKKKQNDEVKSDEVEESENSLSEIQMLLQMKREELMQQEKVNKSKETELVEEKSEEKDELTTIPPNVTIQSSAKDYSSRKKKKRPFKSLFPVSAQLDNRGKMSSLNDILLLAERSAHKTPPNIRDIRFGSGDNSHLGWFSERIDTFRLLKTEANYHKEHDNLEYALHLEIWKGNIGNAIELAANHNQLSDWLVSLAPLGSTALWRHACSLYADQLVKEGQTYRAVLYLLGVLDVEGAIELLRKKKMYREALCLAKIRLSPDNSLIGQLLNEWSTQSVKEGNYELSAKCWVAKGDLGNASKTLSLRCDPNSLKVAAQLANVGGLQTDALTFAEQSITDFLLRNNWASVTEIVDTFPSLKVFTYVAEVHQCIHIIFKNLTSDETMWELTPDKNPASLLIWTPCTLDDKPFVHYILHNWISKNLVTMNDQIIVMRAFLQKRIQVNTSTLAQNQLIFQISLVLTCALLAYVEKSDLSGLNYIIKSLELSYNSCHIQIFQILCRLLLPYGVTDLRSCLPLRETLDKAQYPLMFQTIRAYCSLAVLRFLVDDESKVDINPLDSSILTSENLDYIDDEDDDRSNVDGLIVHQLISNLLLDSRAKLYVLKMELNYVQKSIVNVMAKSKLNQNEPDSKCLSKSSSVASNVSEKMIDYVDNFEISDEETVVESTESEDEINFTLPCDERYSLDGLDLSLLRAEKSRIEKQLKLNDDVDVFPDPIESAFHLIELCRHHQLHNVQHQVRNWALRFAPLKEQRHKLSVS